jgi:hypothetical protein
MIINICKNASEPGIRAAQFASKKLNEAMKEWGSQAGCFYRQFTIRDF